MIFTSKNYVFNLQCRLQTLCAEHISNNSPPKTQTFSEKEIIIGYFELPATIHSAERTACVSNNKCYYSMFNIEFFSLIVDGKGSQPLYGWNFSEYNVFRKSEYLSELNFNSPDIKINENYQIQMIIIIQSLGNNAKMLLHLMGPPPSDSHPKNI